MNIKMLKAALAGLILSVCGFANAGLILTQSTATTDTNNVTTFDWATIMFTSQYTDTITLGNMLSGYAHHHGNTDLDTMLNVFDGSTWINVFRADILAGNILLSSLYSSPITFTGMTISGIRLTGNYSVHQMYHSVSTNMTYTLSGTPVPEPSTLAIFALGMIGLASRKFKIQS